MNQQLNNRNPLLDKEFLAALDAHRERETYARVIALSFDEQPLEQIEGRVTQGSVNIDGSSAVRRTCSLSLIAEDLNINDFYWGLKSKFKLEIGLRNNIKDTVCGINPDTFEQYTWGEKYPQDIIWFPQGIYAITTFNTSQNTNNYSISISGKDKMCFLNGDLGGSLTASIDFGMEEYYDDVNNITTYTPIPIEKIIREAVHTYALEPYHNIVINDLDEIAVELLEYKGDASTPMYLLYNTTQNEFTNFTMNGDMKCIDTNGIKYFLNNDKNDKEQQLIYNERIELTAIPSAIEPTEVTFASDSTNTKYTIAKIIYGQTVGYRPTELTYAGELISNIGESITSVLDKIKKMLGEYEYFYDLDGRFIFQRKKTYIQSTWNNMVKVGDDVYVDDAAYSSSTMYEFTDGQLITSFSNSPNLTNLRNDFSVWGERESVSGVKIPIHYRYAIDKKPTQYTSLDGVTYTYPEVDWRELIYRMAEDHHKYSQYDDYISRLITANNTYYDGTTGYEQYYIDMYSFWRELYTGTEWTEQVMKAPDQLNFWFDFLDAESELGQFSVKAIGDRVKAVNDTAITAIYFREVPDLIFTSGSDYDNKQLAGKSGYTKVLMSGALENLFRISAQGKSAQDVIDELVYNHSYCIESVTIQSVPIYYLEPNVRIFVDDRKSQIQGEYIVSKMTIPLTYNGTMSITATKAPTQLY